jgi:hypothetical protein
VATGNQLRYQAAPDDPTPAGHEHSHRVTLLMRYGLS